MSKLDSIQDRALQLAGQIGDGIRHVPGHAQEWFKVGVAVGAARAGRKAMMRSTRRHPVISATAAAAVMATAAGLVVYAYRRRRETQGREAIEGRGRRVPAARVGQTSRERDVRHQPAEAHGGDEGA